MKLVQALRLSTTPKIALVGSGGKTTAIFRIADQLPKPVIISTTTHLSPEQIAIADYYYAIESVDEIFQVFEGLPKKVLVITSRTIENDRVCGLSAPIMEEVISLANKRSLSLLIEADGSKLRPLKAPAEHEPAIPDYTWKHSMLPGNIGNHTEKGKLSGLDAVIVVVGLSGLGKPLLPVWVHRPKQFAQLSGLQPGEPVSIQGLARVLMHPNGGIKNIPSNVKRIALLNQADEIQDQSLARQLAWQLLPTYHSVVITSLVHSSTRTVENAEIKEQKRSEVIAVHEPVAGVVLAAGGSSRLGRPKQLLDWHGKTLVRHAVDKALSANLSPVIVVLGAYYEEVRKELVDLPVIIVNNEEWEQGQSTSVRASLEFLPEEVGAAIFLLVDQPEISSSLIHSLIERHAVSLDPIVAPMIHGKRGNPVLFDRETFSDLRTLRGDVGGRALFDHYSVTYLEVEDNHINLDIDTEDDYQQLTHSPE